MARLDWTVEGVDGAETWTWTWIVECGRHGSVMGCGWGIVRRQG